MKSKVGIHSIEYNKVPHTNPLWPRRMRENGEFVQVAVKGALTQLVQNRDLTQSRRGDRTTPPVTSFGHHVL